MENSINIGFSGRRSGLDDTLKENIKEHLLLIKKDYQNITAFHNDGEGADQDFAKIFRRNCLRFHSGFDDYHMLLAWFGRES